MCNHKVDQFNCKHKEVIYCPICDKVYCKACGREWGGKEFLPYVPQHSYRPDTTSASTDFPPTWTFTTVQ